MREKERLDATGDAIHALAAEANGGMKVAKVKIYSTPTCPWCIRAKTFLKNKRVDFEDIDVSRNREASRELVEKSGQMGVPVLDIDGKIIVGFDQEAIVAALN